MAQLIITNEAAAASTAITIEIDGVLRTRPIKAIISGIQTDTSATTVATALTVVTDTPDSNGEIQLSDENTIIVYLAAQLWYTDALILNVEYEDELIRT